MFTDESRFALEPDDKRIRIWCKQGTRNQPQNITEHHAFPGGSIMVWAGISLGYRTDLHIFKRGFLTAVRYRDEVLEPIVRLYAAAVDPTFVLMDDNAVPIELTSSMATWRVKGLRVWRGQHIRPTLIPLKIFGILKAVKWVYLYFTTTEGSNFKKKT
ncbi:transposable element Tcb1 transposase [Trichonephila clavipes]|nr:transposable element Tcb1 transposase [Trichonephila clavipes]